MQRSVQTLYPLVRGHHQVDFWAMEFVQHVEFLSFRKMNGVEYLARFSSCLIEKGSEKAEIGEKNCEYLTN
jgi:hypothetical protein